MICHLVFVQFVLMKTWNERTTRIEVTFEEVKEQVEKDFLAADEEGGEGEDLSVTTSSGEYIDHDYWNQPYSCSSDYHSD